MSGKTAYERWLNRELPKTAEESALWKQWNAAKAGVR